MKTIHRSALQFVAKSPDYSFFASAGSKYGDRIRIASEIAATRILSPYLLRVMRQVNHLRAFDARAAGTSLEKEVLAIFQVNDMYTASRSMRLPAGAAHIDTDLVVTHRQGCMAYSVLVECKNFTRKRVDQGVVAQLNQTRLLVGAQCALLISALGLQRGAITLLAEFPHLAHYTIDGLKEAMQSGQLDDAIPLLAFSGITACSEIDELNRLVQSFDHIANMMYFMDSSRSKLPLRAAIQLIKASYAHLSDDIRGIKHRHVSNLSSLLYYFSRDVREFLSEQQIIHGDCLAECLCVAHFAALSLSQERQLYEDAARLPWRQAFYKTPFQALRIAQNICGTFGDIDLPEFEHGSLNHVIPVLESLVYSQNRGAGNV